MASFLKLKLGKNHNNAYNINNQVRSTISFDPKKNNFLLLQVSLIAINILGFELEGRKLSSTENVADKVNALMNDPEYQSPYDDLAFEMYVDIKVAKIIREMEMKKHVAVISKSSNFIMK